MFAAAVLMLGMGACKDSDAPVIPSQQEESEESLIGLWYEEFDYEDVTEDGKPFNHALIAVEAKADHTGYVALAVFDDEFNEPLEIYGGPTDAPFTWQMTDKGHVTLKDPNTGTSIELASTRSDGNHSDFVDIGQIDMNCTQGSVAFSNSSHSGSLKRAGSNKSDLIQDWMAKSTLPRACVTDSIPVELFPDYMNYVFNYPSIDPYGNESDPIESDEFEQGSYTPAEGTTVPEADLLNLYVEDDGTGVDKSAMNNVVVTSENKPVPFYDSDYKLPGAKFSKDASQYYYIDYNGNEKIEKAFTSDFTMETFFFSWILPLLIFFLLQQFLMKKLKDTV